MGDLPENEFSRCHHSYIIYFPAIREKKKNSYVLENGKISMEGKSSDLINDPRIVAAYLGKLATNEQKKDA